MLIETMPYPPNRKDSCDTEIRIFSDLNEWIDYSFVISTCRLEEAVNTLTGAFTTWMETDPNIPLFEALEQALADAGITFESGMNAVEEPTTNEEGYVHPCA